MGKTVLIIGSGAREHALAWKLAQSPRVSRLIVAPGNDGMPSEWERWSFDGAPAEFHGLATRAREMGVGLAVVGPDNPLADGIVDVFEAAKLRVFGPTAAAARIESSKIFAKEVMRDAGVPTPRHFTAGDRAEASKILKSVPWPKDQTGGGWVIKADGLALGKGVRVCSTFEEAESAVEGLLPLSGRVLIEEQVRGEELSWMAFCDGEHCALLEPARDYKRVSDGDQGPNTGGMGAFSPVPGIPPLDRAMRTQVFEPVLREMRRRGTPFRGVLYAGLMIDPRSGRFWVLEFNARFGDPEAQVLLPRMADDFYVWANAAAAGTLGELPPNVPFIGDSAVYVVAAARGYPDSPEKGKAIQGVTPGADGYFFGGVKKGVSAALDTSGGRVLGSLGVSKSLALARTLAYERMEKVRFDGVHYRRDIAKEAQG